MSGVCPILKTREMLYRGGAVARSEDDDDIIVTIDGLEMVYDDAPVIIGAGSYREVRGGGGDGGDGGIDSLRIMDTLHDLEVRESIRSLVSGGYATVPDRSSIIDRYSSVPGGLMKIEAAARDDLRKKYR